MKKDFFTSLPSEIIIEIVSSLPIKPIISCKCVCKSLLNLVESPEFAVSHLSKSVPGLASFQGMHRPGSYKVFEFVDELARRDSLHYRYLAFNFNFNFPLQAYIHSSVNGFVFMYHGNLMRPHNLFICNPVTHDYVTLPHHSNCMFLKQTFGFGVSKVTGQYKLVRIFQSRNESVPPQCEVYTLGTGSWRSIKGDGPLFGEVGGGTFANGNLHWLVSDSKTCECVSCFDLETELFSTFSPPPNFRGANLCCLSYLGDCLCLCSNFDNLVVIWMMKEYGDEKSWTLELVFEKPSPRKFGAFRLWTELYRFGFPVKVFEDGHVLVAREDGPGLFCYSRNTGRIEEIIPFQVPSNCHNSSIIYTPSFLSVKMFAMENISSF